MDGPGLGHRAEPTDRADRAGEVHAEGHGQVMSVPAKGRPAAANGDGEARRGTGFRAVAQSVGAAMIGVQSRRNRERDFTTGKPLHFVIGGLVGTAIFLLVVWLLVQYVLATS